MAHPCENCKIRAHYDAKPLQERINKKHGTHTVEYAEQIGLGTRKYTIVSIDKKD